MEQSSLMNLALRSILIWGLIYFFMSSIPAVNIPMSNKIIIATLVIFLYGIIEYVLLTFEAPSGLCQTLCGSSFSVDGTYPGVDKYVQDALQQLKVQEQAGPAVMPLGVSAQQQVPVQIQPQQLAPAAQQPVYPSAVPTAAPVVAAPPVAPAAPPASVPIREGFGNFGYF
jgi:hypothetical protein